MRTVRVLATLSCLLLTACSVLLPQSAPAEEALEVPPVSEAEVVEEVVQVLPAGSSTSGGEIGPTTVEIIGDDPSALREFVEHWLGSTYPGQTAGTVTVYLGSLPPGLPYDLPLPENARVIGSVQQTSLFDVQVILETSLSPEEAVAFYADSLPGLGWEAVSAGGYGGGFVPGEVGLTYCLGDDTSLNIQTGVWPTGMTDLRIYSYSNPDYSPCNPGAEYGPGSDSSPIPTLVNPPGAQMTGSGGGGSSWSEGGMTESYNETQLLTDLSAGELAAYYSEQLVEAGWVPLESGEADGYAWSTWSVTDENGQVWSGTLVLLEVSPGSGKIFAYVQVAR